jgi:hypothetical protein
MARQHFCGLKHLATLFALAALASCGGGGGGGSPPASPSQPASPSTPANLTMANAPSFANNVALAARMAATMRLGPNLTTTATPGMFTEPGCQSIGGPSGPATVTVTPATGNVIGTVTYNSFHRCYDVRVSGTSSITGTFNSPQVDIVNYTLSGLTFTAGGQTYQMSGTATLDWAPFTGGAAIYALTLNATVSGAASFSLENFRVDSDITAGIENLSISGRVAMSDGFVDVTPRASPPRVELVTPSTGLQNGGVVMTGATTVATVFYNGANPPAISIAPK